MRCKFNRKPEYSYSIDLVDKKGEPHALRTRIYTLYWLIDRMRRGYSPIIGICGDQRDGKSYFAVYISYIILKMFGKKFSIERHTVYNAKDINLKLSRITNEPIILDESSYTYYKREWYKKPHLALSKIIFTQGRKTIAYIFVSPFINDIDKAFTKHFDIILDVKGRGFAKSYKMYKKHMAFSDRENKKWWWDDIILNIGKLPADFKQILKIYKKNSEIEKDKIEREDQKKDGSKTFKDILRSI